MSPRENPPELNRIDFLFLQPAMIALIGIEFTIPLCIAPGHRFCSIRSPGARDGGTPLYVYNTLIREDAHRRDGVMSHPVRRVCTHNCTYGHILYIYIYVQKHTWLHNCMYVRTYIYIYTHKTYMVASKRRKKCGNQIYASKSTFEDKHQLLF